MTMTTDLREDLPVLLNRLLTDLGPPGDEPVLTDVRIAWPTVASTDLAAADIKVVGDRYEVRVAAGRPGGGAVWSSVLAGRCVENASPRPPVPARPVGVPGWSDPETLDPFVVLPGVAEHIDLVVRGEDGGHVVYVTVDQGSSWVTLVRVVVGVVSMVLPDVVPSRIGRVHITRVVPTVAVLEVGPVAGGAVDVRLQGLDGRGFLEFRQLR